MNVVIPKKDKPRISSANFISSPAQFCFAAARPLGLLIFANDYIWKYHFLKILSERVCASCNFLCNARNGNHHMQSLERLVSRSIIGR